MQTINNNYDGAPVDLDTALSMTGHGKFSIYLILIVGGTLASTMIDNLGASFALPAVACELDLSSAEKGLFSGASFLGMVLTTCSWGFISDTFGRRKVMFLSLGVFWLSSFTASLAPMLWLMVVLRFVAGAGSSGMASIIFVYMVEFLPPKDRMRYLSHSCIFLGISFCLVPATAWLILPLKWSLDLGFVVLKSWRILCLLNGSYMLVVFLGMLRLPESPKYLISIDKHREALDVLRKVFSQNTGRSQSEYPVREIKKKMDDERTSKVLVNGDISVSTIFKEMRGQIALIFGKKHIFATSLNCILQFWIYLSTYGLYVWLPDIQNRMMTYNKANPNATVTICGAMNVQLNTTSNFTCQSEIEGGVYITLLIIGVNYSIGFVLSGLLVNVIGKRTFLATFQLMGGLTCFGLLWARNQIFYTIFTTLFIAKVGLCVTLMNSIFADLYPTQLRGTAICISLTVGWIGAGIGGLLSGMLFTHGCVPTIFALSGITVGTGFLTLYIPKPSIYDERTTVA